MKIADETCLEDFQSLVESLEQTLYGIMYAAEAQRDNPVLEQIYEDSKKALDLIGSERAWGYYVQ